MSEPRRRTFLKGALGAPLLLRGATWGGTRPWPSAGPEEGQDGLSFSNIDPSDDGETLRVPAGYVVDVLARWGDPLFEGQEPFALEALTGEEQARRFGFNCDFNGFFPLGEAPGRGLLCVNHEYPAGEEMFPDHDRKHRPQAQVEVELAAVGLSVIEVARSAGGAWRVVRPSAYNRRVTAHTPIELTGPAAGHALLATERDPSGLTALGTFANCSGGKTPWNTVLSGEENFHEFFGAGGDDDLELDELQLRYGLEAGWSEYRWEAHVPHFDLRKHPNEANHHGWVVELDPFEPQAAPRKRTALGRIRHEGATTTLAADRRVVVYMGDDEAGEHVYKFVSEEPFEVASGGRGASGRDLLDHGTLFVARLEPEGTGRWLPLVAEGPLADRSLAEILVDTRGSARALGATGLDRPEDVQRNPVDGSVFVVLTKDGDRATPDHANPRAPNRHGHVIELLEEGGDAAATSFRWSFFLLCGPPEAGARYADIDPEAVNPVSCPDNIAFDPLGNLWIATDGQPKAQDTNDALYAVATRGPRRGLTRRFLTGPAECEICGPEFTPDGSTLFVNVQHPGEGRGIGREHSSHWPDGGDAPPRPSVVAIRRADGGPIGS